MIIRPATIMRNDYNLISEYAHQSGEIVYLTKYGKGDLVVMSIKTFEQREEKFKFYHTVMQADLDRQKSAEELFDGDDAIARLRRNLLTDYAIRTGLKILPQAWHDLLEIGFVYSRQGKRLEASAVTCSIVSKLKELQDFAMLGNKTPLSSLNEKKYLMLMIDKYACIYRKVENTVYIYHITELQRDYPKLMK